MPDPLMQSRTRREPARRRWRAAARRARSRPWADCGRKKAPPVEKGMPRSTRSGGGSVEGGEVEAVRFARREAGRSAEAAARGARAAPRGRRRARRRSRELGRREEGISRLLAPCQGRSCRCCGARCAACEDSIAHEDVERRLSSSHVALLENSWEGGGCSLSARALFEERLHRRAPNFNFRSPCDIHWCLVAAAASVPSR